MGFRIKAPPEEPDGKQQINLTDADSGLMRRSKQHEYRQACNAQAVVDAGSARLTLMLQKIHAARALSMVLKRSWTTGLLPTSSTCRPPGWTIRPARLINPYLKVWMV